jgi:NTE family protein
VSGSAGGGFALVIGGGGAVASASCLGTLKALSEVAGVDASQARVVIGTSAGAAIAADLRLGHTIESMEADLASHNDEAAISMCTAWTSKPDLVRRAVGSSYVMAQSAMSKVWRMSTPWPVVQRAFPASLMSIPPEHWDARYPGGWPQHELWLVASDLDTGRRVVLTANGHRGGGVSLSRAVQASCAVPGVFAPVRIGGDRLVDGGVKSATNLDIAARTGCRAVIALAPMGFDRRQPPGYVQALGRLKTNARIDQEAATVRRAGMAVFTVRPGADELSHHRLNILSKQGHADIMKAAYEAMARRLAAGDGRHVIDQIRAEALAA